MEDFVAQCALGIVGLGEAAVDMRDGVGVGDDGSKGCFVL